MTLALTKGFTGVTSSCAAERGRGVLPAVVRGVRTVGVVVVVVVVAAEAAEGASRGARLVFPVRAAAREGFNGREVWLVWRSMGMVRCGGVRSEGNSAGSRREHGHCRGGGGGGQRLGGRLLGGRRCVDLLMDDWRWREIKASLRRELGGCLYSNVADQAEENAAPIARR